MIDISKNGIYQTDKTYQENVDLGPFIQNFSQAEIDNLIEYKNQSVDFLGYKLNNALGVPAGPLLSASWCKLASDLNFSVITYKTIRSSFHPCHPLPNVISVENNAIFSHNLKETIQAKDCNNLNKLTITNSFGMPSQSYEFLEKDIPEAKKAMKKGQILVVSVVATDMNRAVDGYLESALFAEKLGADAIEVNLSCPNVKDSSSMLYLDNQLTFEICKKITSKINIPLIIKIGYLTNDNLFEAILNNASDSGVSAVSGVNSFSMKVYQNNSAALGESRLSGGICGYAIKPIGIDFTKRARMIIDKNNLNLKLIAMGGIMNESDFNDYLQSGANIAMSATGMMWFPFMAKKYANKYQKNLINE